jgi:phosphoribosyl 1,2-cyclic phosphate phosphodiesterase
MEGRFLFLGTGSALGVPLIACKCPVCTSLVAYNRRLRSSGLILLENKKFLIDAGPDFRQQALKYSIDHLDGVLFTHLHADHIAGLEDLRPLYYAYNKSLPCLVSKKTRKEVIRRFLYLFRGLHAAPYFDFQETKGTSGSSQFEGMKFSFITYHQGDVPVHGYRIGDFAYMTDIGQYQEKIFDQLRGVQTLVMSLLRHQSTSHHLGLEETMQIAQKVGAKKVYFTHLSHEIDHEKWSLSLPPGYFLAYDGLQLSFTYEE